MSEPDPERREAATQQLLQLLAGKWVVQAIATAAELGIADALSDGPRTADDLARTLDCDPDALQRLLRALAGEGLVELDLEDRYVLTAVGEALKTGALRDLARFVGSESQWDPWHALPHTIRTGEPAFEHVHGQELYEYLAERPAEAARYDAAIDVFTAHTAAALAERCDLDQVGCIVDVGGGGGTLLIDLLERHPNLRGILFDLEHVIAVARKPGSDSVGARYQTLSGDFFQEVPPGGDVYILKHILHNWGDEDAIRILRSCARALRDGNGDGRVWVVEAVVLPGNRRGLPRLLDLEMLVLTRDGRERTKPQLRRLFSRAGFSLKRSIPLDGATRLLELNRKG